MVVGNLWLQQDIASCSVNELVPQIDIDYYCKVWLANKEACILVLNKLMYMYIVIDNQYQFGEPTH